MQMREKYGPVFKVWVGPNKVLVFISDSEWTEFFLSVPKYINKNYPYDLIYPWLGQGLLTSNGKLFCYSFRTFFGNLNLISTKEKIIIYF